MNNLDLNFIIQQLETILLLITNLHRHQFTKRFAYEKILIGKCYQIKKVP